MLLRCEECLVIYVHLFNREQTEDEFRKAMAQ
jgi:hypothetical protein